MYFTEKVPQQKDSYAFVVKHESNPDSMAGVQGTSWLGGCGVGFMKQFVYSPYRDNYKEIASWISALYRELFNPGHILYTLASNQLTYASQEALKLIGSEQLAEWPNLYHGPHTIHLFKVNIRDAVGVFCNEYGEPYEVMPETIPPRKKHTAPKGSSYGDKLPKRNPNEQPTAHPAV